jgi:hypothetical protein
MSANPLLFQRSQNVAKLPNDEAVTAAEPSVCQRSRGDTSLLETQASLATQALSSQRSQNVAKLPHFVADTGRPAGAFLSHSDFVFCVDGVRT